jgi:hypothetical protein
VYGRRDRRLLAKHLDRPAADRFDYRVHVGGLWGSRTRHTVLTSGDW